MNSQAAVERRDHIRMPVPVVVSAPQGAEDEANQIAAAVLDISRSGARLLIAQELPPGQQLQIMPQHASGQSYWPAWAEVVWSSHWGDSQYLVGIRFRRLLPEMGILDLLVPSRSSG